MYYHLPKVFMRFLKIFCLLIFTSITALAADGGKKSSADSLKRPVNYPKPPVTAERLFYVQRSQNTNTIVYDVNIDKNGKPNADEPVKVYWIRYADKGQQADLSYIQRKFAYGVNSKFSDPFKSLSWLLS